MPVFKTGRARSASRPVFFCAFLLIASAAGPLAQQAPPPAGTTPRAPATGAPAKPAGPALVFTSDAGIVIFTVRAEGATDFEAFFTKVREALWVGTKPEYERMAGSWSLLKVAEGPLAGQLTYWTVIDPVVKGVDYDPVKILGDVFPTEALGLYPKLKDALVSVNRVNLAPAVRMNVGCFLAGILPCQKLRLNPPYTR